VYPAVLITLGSFDITSFGLLVCVAVVVGARIFHRECRRGHVPARALNAALGGVVGGLAGAKLLWVLEHVGHDTLTSLVLARSGMSWFGGVIGGIATGAVLLRRAGIALAPAMAAGAPALAVGQAIGRIGCFLVGDDYGHATDLPWGVAFPNGTPPIDVHVHPTQLYEAVFLLMLYHTLTVWRSRGVADASIVGRYLALAGTFRFALEFVRTNARVLGPLTVAHLAAACVVAAGVGLLTMGSRPVEQPATRITRQVM
jgi:phosphatidylglycerol---prolipoprotein diacylglyceryl transferase